VRSCAQLATWNGPAQTLSVAASKLQAARSVAVLVQYEHCGPMLGAAKLAG